jgi:hypothetical protein
MSADSGFIFADTNGRSLRFEMFGYEFPNIDLHPASYHDANWLHCKITIDADITHFANAYLLTDELQELAASLRHILGSTSPSDSRAFEPTEPWISLRLSRIDRGRIDVLSRLDLHPMIGPVIEFNLECAPADLQKTLSSLDLTVATFPQRGTP